MVLARARPEDAHVVLDFLIRDAEVVGGAAFGSDAQFVENVFRRSVCKVFPGPETAGEFEEDGGVGAGVAGRIDGLADAGDAALGGGDGAVFLLVQ